MNEFKKTKNGFTLLEMLVVISVIAVLAAIGFVNIAAARRSANLADGTLAISQALESARAAATAGQNNSDQSVYLASDRVVNFDGSVYVPGTGVETVFPDSSITTNQTGTTVTFYRLNGQSSFNGTITVRNDSGDTKIINVNSNGQISAP